MSSTGSVEEQVRAATRAEADRLREVRPLRLPPASTVPHSARAGTGVRRARHWRSWLVPATAAAAVIALAISLVIVRGIPNGHQVPDRGNGAGGVPRYYVTLSGTGLMVGNTFTGAKVAVVPSPSGTTFAGIAAAADDRTFVVDTEPGSASDYSLPRAWYLLRIAPGTSSPAQLSKLPIPSLTDIDAIALSGSGREFAVATQGKTTNEIRIYSVATGKLLHTWSTKVGGVFGDGAYFTEQSRALAWIDGDRAVAFFSSGRTEPAGLITGAERLFRDKRLSGPERLKEEKALLKKYGGIRFDMTWRRLDLASGGGDLMAQSRVIWSWTSQTLDAGPPTCQYGWIQGISADGKTVVCGSLSLAQGTQRKPVSWRVAWLAFSVPAGAARTLHQVIVRSGQQPFVYPLWAGTSGNTIIGEWGVETSSGPQKNPPVGVISNGRFQQLPSPPDAGAMAPSVTW